MGGGEKQGAFVAWVSLEQRVGVEAGDGIKAGLYCRSCGLRWQQCLSPKVSPHVMSHQASTEWDKCHGLHFIGSNRGSEIATVIVSKREAALEPGVANSSSPTFGPFLAVLGQAP